eukprot:CAMPEP_0117511726 /NCGR_PEP_ID=MMETSP0784-20121206/28657_1 /TAXON_ID=39447 /ORGANISM="" /LENGTH=155 /DNA_ID=CAMNT_0005307409 /DNA_START=623 /DNA_END=1090 /DNA_ORIENTATION=+
MNALLTIKTVTNTKLMGEMSVNRSSEEMSRATLGKNATKITAATCRACEAPLKTQGKMRGNRSAKNLMYAAIAQKEPPTMMPDTMEPTFGPRMAPTLSTYDSVPVTWAIVTMSLRDCATQYEQQKRHNKPKGTPTGQEEYARADGGGHHHHDRAA